jgi:PilZ domain
MSAIATQKLVSDCLLRASASSPRWRNQDCHRYPLCFRRSATRPSLLFQKHLNYRSIATSWSKPALRPATASGSGDKIACTICDLSITGAALEISDLSVIPERFRLVMPEDRLRLTCRVVRRSDFRIDVAFD